MWKNTRINRRSNSVFYGFCFLYNIHRFKKFIQRARKFYEDRKFYIETRRKIKDYKSHKLKEKNVSKFNYISVLYFFIDCRNEWFKSKVK